LHNLGRASLCASLRARLGRSLDLRNQARPSRRVSRQRSDFRAPIKKCRLWLDYLAYLAIRSVVAFAQMLSIEQSYALAGFLGWVMYKIDKRHRQVGIDNLARAFGDQYSPAQRDEIVRGIYRHFCMMLMEILHTPRRLRLEYWRASVVLVNLAPLMDHLMSGDRPLIVLTGHYGNWELAGFLFGMFGFPTVSVARTLDNPYLDR
jgi:Kdo2-lipid IVA lauroyltransferase/acyltransferase